MEIVFEGTTRFDNSYGIVNLNLANALRTRGHRVAFSPFDADAESFGASCAQLGIAPFPLRLVEEYDICIRQFWPPVWDRPKARAFIVIQPWEFGGVPRAWVDALDQVDQLWVHTQFVESCWVEGGADPGKLRLVPLGVHHHDADHVKKVPGQLLFLGGGIWRKGVDLFIRALDGLSDRELEKVRPVIKESGSDSFYRGQSLVDVTLDAFPRVRAIAEVRRESLSRADLDVLIAQSVALIHPYRAEGFYLGGLEAMGLGTVVAMTRGGAGDDYANDDNAVMVEARNTIGNGMDLTGIGPTNGELHWLEVSVADLTRAIRVVLSEDAPTRADVQARIEKGYQTSRLFSWDNSARHAEHAIAATLTGDRAMSDHFAQVEESLTRVLDTWSLSDLNVATALMLEHQDLHGAYELLGQYPEVLPPNAQAMSDQLAALLVGRVDLWRDAHYRMRMHQLLGAGRVGRSEPSSAYELSNDR